jgi:hypothetical protein
MGTLFCARFSGRKPPMRGCDGNRSLTEPSFQKVAEPRVVFDQTVNQIVVLMQWNELKGRLSVDGYDHRLLLTELPVLA